MKKLLDFIFSMRFMAVVVIMFAVSIAAATFIENDFGHASARALVYDALWFELLLLAGMVNLIAVLFRKKIHNKARFSVFLFHAAFILIIAGAGITRYFGQEGTMAIREHTSSDSVLSLQAYMQVTAGTGDDLFVAADPVAFSSLGRNRYKKVIQTADHTIEIKVTGFIENAVPFLEEAREGNPIADFIVSGENGRQRIMLSEGELKQVHNVHLLFDTLSLKEEVVRLLPTDSALFFSAPFDVEMTDMVNMEGANKVILTRDSIYLWQPMKIYSFGGTSLVLNGYTYRGIIAARPAPSGQNTMQSAVLLELSSGQGTKLMTVWGLAGLPGIPQTIALDDYKLSISYGSIYKSIPFELALDDFILQRYPGSSSPSWFESSVILRDREKGLTEPRRIYMNNVLKYKGYRFYQSSYDADEQGTVLSVNRDAAGTAVTYAGYLIMGLGMILSLLNRKSRFHLLMGRNKVQQAGKRVSLILLLMTGIAGMTFAVENGEAGSATLIDRDHAATFGKMLVQSGDGRIEPVHTLASDVLNKLYRKASYNGMDANQVMLGMMADPQTWQHEAIIRSPFRQIQEILGNQGKYYPFSSFFEGNRYVLQDYVEEAYRKTPGSRSKFDNEVIRLDERVNICYLVFTGDLLRIFPLPEDSTQTWYSYRNLQGRITTADSFYIENLMPLYLQDVASSMQSGNWQDPGEILAGIRAVQQQYADPDILPGDRKTAAEIFLNRSDIFSRVSKVYALVGFILLLLQFIAVFRPGIRLQIPVLLSAIFIILAFTAHGGGLVLRWYVSGHAPWSNGYEALTYIAWVTILAGLLFSFRSSIALSTTAIMSFLILHTAHLSHMDPQITNLVPVLKSYWLVIHVATITASYAFLGLGALLAVINLMLMVFQTGRSFAPVDGKLRQLTDIIEMSLILGLYLLTIGTFLGGVWANESWGRYWGWDPKETWALVTILVYAFVAHMRLIPGMHSLFGFNLAALLAFASVIMTYFGVNYYLSGLHSYAAGDPLPVPDYVYYTLLVVFFLSLLAFFNYRKQYKKPASWPDS